eukprot:XP_001693545.1 UV-damaged DNA binding complex subunit 2 protein [Chlamydomonas reinhardtii]
MTCARCCTLEFHPTHDSVVVSGDKKGGLAVHDRTVYDTVHSCLANAALGAVVVGDSNGCVHLLDPRTRGPHTGRRILTTCQDNRLRVYDNAEWDAKDPTESVFVVGRYISEDFGGVALHPVDVMSAADGGLLRQLTDTNLTTISPVNKPHPRSFDADPGGKAGAGAGGKKRKKGGGKEAAPDFDDDD